MGLLGLESNAFLSDRIFDVVDTDRDSYITFAQFATIMDTLINGEEDEKHEFSFSLFDVYDTGYFDFEEFREIIGKIVAHWCIITGSQVKIEREGLKEIFNKMDQNEDGIVDIDEYKQALKGNSQLFQWFDLLNQGIQDGKQTQKDIIDLKLNALTDVLELQTKLSKVMN
jgi:Ca2+-binding EF-hand superfamily protein